MGSYIGTVFLSTSVYDQEKRKKKKQKANFCLDSNVIFACATFIFIFSLTRNVNFPGKLDFSKRTANTNNFFKVWFSLRLWFYHLEWMVGWGERKAWEHTFPLLGHQLESCVGYCGYGFPALCFSRDPNVKQNGKLDPHSLWVRYLGDSDKVRETSACSWHILNRYCPWTYLHWQLFILGQCGFHEMKAVFPFLTGRDFSFHVRHSQNIYIYI